MAKRATLATFAPSPMTGEPEVSAEALSRPEPEPQAEARSARQVRVGEAPQGRRKYPHVSVYLPAETIRTLKLIALEHGTRVNELCAEAINAWLDANGHARGKRFKV